MTELPLYNKILILLINLLGIWLGFLVYRNNPKGKPHRIFIFMAALMLLWVNFAYFARLIGDAQADLSLFLLKIAWFITPLFFTLLYFLVIHLLELEKEYKTLSRVVFILGVITILITGFTSLIINGADFINGNLRIIYGRGMIPFLSVTFFFICVTLYPLFKQHLISSPKEKKKIEYFLIGIFIFYLANLIFNILSPLILDITHLYWIGDYSAIFLLGFTACAIIKQELFGIKIILTELLVSIFGILLFVQIFFSDTGFEYARNILAFIIFLFLGYFLIKEFFRGIETQKKIGALEKQLLEKELETERGIKEALWEVSEEKQKKLYEWMTRDEFLENLKLKQEILDLVARVKELEKELAKEKRKRK